MESLSTIDTFRGEFEFLSNFYHAPCLYVIRAGTTTFGFECPTSEHAYQAHKATNHHDAMHVLTAPTPAEAKSRGRKVMPWRSDWNVVRFESMYSVLMRKFTYLPELRAKLLDTTPARLIEGNTWGDAYWGVCNGVGQNWLGRALMEIRSKLWAQDAAAAKCDAHHWVIDPIDPRVGGKSLGQCAKCKGQKYFSNFIK